MSDPALGLLMLGLIVVVIMMGFPTAFTLMGLGIFFGFIAFYVPGESWVHNRVFDLMVQRTYGAMTNDVLISIPLFVLMGYVMERGALVMLQGIAEITRCIVCLRTGKWPARLKDVAEIDVVEEQLAHSEYVSEAERKLAIERAQEIDETARQRGMGGDLNT